MNKSEFTALGKNCYIFQKKRMNGGSIICKKLKKAQKTFYFFDKTLYDGYNTLNLGALDQCQEEN